MSMEGTLNIPQFASFAIYDDNGIAVTTTIPFTKKFTIVDRDYFQFHKTNPSNALRIGTPTIGRLSGKKIIQVTRRIEKDGGKFGGMLVMGIAPEFFTLFSDDQVLGENGILAFVGEDGIERMSKVGNEQRNSFPLSTQKNRFRSCGQRYSRISRWQNAFYRHAQISRLSVLCLGWTGSARRTSAI